ncbi:cell envelope integrity protein CreD [Sphingobacterium alkalisoli]|nr:cell envelope integrity protein CreD [Sphingobacterium alkalisoli]
METTPHNMPPQLPPNVPSFWEKIFNSVLLKLGVIFFLILLLLLPMSLVDDLIRERKYREQDVTAEISSKWGREQVISSPILAIPYDYVRETTERDEKGKDNIIKSIEQDWIFLLPNQVNIKTNVTPEYLKRGIYQSVVYNAQVEMAGDFSGLEQEKLGTDLNSVRWKDAKLVFGIRDLKGLLSSPTLTWDTTMMEIGTFEKTLQLFESNLVANIPLSDIGDTQKSFSIKMDLRGSKSLNYFPIANQTSIYVAGRWNNPSFNGGYLPEDRSVEADQFKATWKIPSFNRSLPAQWEGNPGRLYSFSGIDLNESRYFAQDELPTEMSSATNTTGSFTRSSDADMVQINFLPEVNNYQKTTRVAKYGILVIILTFASLFFTEILKKRRIHIIQYILIGVAMVLFYSLLLAISEYLNFNIAYVLAAVATVGLITSFIKSITKDLKIALLFAGILCLFYGFIFVLMQLRDYSLIVGTIGIFIILAVLMRVSTRINWYQFDRK